MDVEQITTIGYNHHHHHHHCMIIVALTGERRHVVPSWVDDDRQAFLYVCLSLNIFIHQHMLIATNENKQRNNLKLSKKIINKMCTHQLIAILTKIPIKLFAFS